ncbi:hypothetical protein Tco_0895558 [Tanacetum coccineum]|uniref:Uncharacterized protein n=1 Tax=Tanacetum coccineum TaxID=301880 RepID=A0ABQ5CID1_9ASTR
MHNLFQGDNVTSGTSTLRLVEGNGKGNDDVGNGMGKIGGVLDGGGNDSGWEVSGDSALSRIMAALLPKEWVGLASSGEGDIGNGGDAGSGGDGIWGSGDEYDVSGDG